MLSIQVLALAHLPHLRNKKRATCSTATTDHMRPSWRAHAGPPAHDTGALGGCRFVCSIRSENSRSRLARPPVPFRTRKDWIERTFIVYQVQRMGSKENGNNGPEDSQETYTLHRYIQFFSFIFSSKNPRIVYNQSQVFHQRVSSTISTRERQAWLIGPNHLLWMR